MREFVEARGSSLSIVILSVIFKADCAGRRSESSSLLESQSHSATSAKRTLRTAYVRPAQGVRKACARPCTSRVLNLGKAEGAFGLLALIRALTTHLLFVDLLPDGAGAGRSCGTAAGSATWIWHCKRLLSSALCSALLSPLSVSRQTTRLELGLDTVSILLRQSHCSRPISVLPNAFVVCSDPAQSSRPCACPAQAVCSESASRTQASNAGHTKGLQKLLKQQFFPL